MQLTYNGYNLDNPKNYGVSNFDGGLAPMRGDNIAAPEVSGRLYVPKYKDQMKHQIFMWCDGDTNMETLLNTVFTSGKHTYQITIGNTTYSYADAEVVDLRYNIGTVDQYYKLTIDIIVAKP